MKQIVIRIVDPKIPVMSVMAGEIVDGTFNPFKPDQERAFIEAHAPLDCDLVHFDDLFGGVPYIKVSDFSDFALCCISKADRIEFYPGYFVINYED